MNSLLADLVDEFERAVKQRARVEMSWDGLDQPPRYLPALETAREKVKDARGRLREALGLPDREVMGSSE